MGRVVCGGFSGYGLVISEDSLDYGDMGWRRDVVIVSDRVCASVRRKGLGGRGSGVRSK